ncbi:MAG: hypothetical protein QXE81_04465 [Desulfurococcaceae archaeon]
MIVYMGFVSINDLGEPGMQRDYCSKLHEEMRLDASPETPGSKRAHDLHVEWLVVPVNHGAGSTIHLQRTRLKPKPLDWETALYDAFN